MEKRRFGFLNIIKTRNNSILRSDSVPKGFTIIELLVVIVVIGILTAITVVSYTGIMNRADVSLLKMNLAQAAKLVKNDYSLSDAYPINIDSINNGNGIPDSSAVSYEYFTGTNGFCITGTVKSITYRVTNDMGPVEGDCSNWGLVLSLDAGNTSSYPGSGTVWNDLSGFNYNATLINSPAYSSDGSGSFIFNGSSNYATLPPRFTVAKGI